MNAQLRIPIHEIDAHRATEPGYAAALFAAGRADPDGIHWIVPALNLSMLRRAYGRDAVDETSPRRCAGCGQ